MTNRQNPNATGDAKGPAPSAEHDRVIMAAARRVLDGKPSRSTRPQWVFPAALAATVLLAVPLVWMTGAQNDTDPQTRGPAAQIIPAPDAVLRSAPDVLAWTPVGGATSYRVTMRDASANVVWTSDAIEKPEILLTRETQRLFGDGGEFIWSVDASVANRPREFGPYRFRIVPD